MHKSHRRIFLGIFFLCLLVVVAQVPRRLSCSVYTDCGAFCFTFGECGDYEICHAGADFVYCRCGSEKITRVCDWMV